MRNYIRLPPSVSEAQCPFPTASSNIRCVIGNTNGRNQGASSFSRRALGRRNHFLSITPKIQEADGIPETSHTKGNDFSYIRNISVFALIGVPFRPIPRTVLSNPASLMSIVSLSTRRSAGSPVSLAEGRCAQPGGPSPIVSVRRPLNLSHLPPQLSRRAPDHPPELHISIMLSRERFRPRDFVSGFL